MPTHSIDTRALLLRTSVFGDLPEDVLVSVADRMQPCALQGGHVLFGAGDPCDALYVLHSGSIGLFRTPRSGGAPHLAGLLSNGETLGTTGLLLGQAHESTARALRDTQLMRLSRKDFERLIDQHPQAILGAAQTALRNLLKRGGDEPRLLPRTFAILPFDDAIHARELAEQLRHALLPFGNCLLIDAPLGHGHGPAWFAEREAEMRFVLYVDDGHNAAWRALCRRQADTLLMVTRADREPAPWPDQPALAEHADLERPRHLILLHPGKSIVPGAARNWRKAVPGITHHHHVRNINDIQRVARLLARRSLGLVLSGGGARGFAAIGVLRALHEKGYDIDLVGGTSIGAIIAAGMALQWDHKQMHANYRAAFIDSRPLSDWTVPLVALCRGERTSRLLQRFFGDLDMEDLPIPFFCVSSDLTRGIAAVHRQGPLWLWLRASCAIPGILPPVLHEGRVYVDGAVINNLPVDVMYDRGVATILACDIRADDVLVTDLERAWQPRAWRQWLQRDRQPGVASILLRAGMVNAENIANQRRELATQVFSPQLDAIGLLDFKSFDRVIEAGYRSAIESLAEPLG
ncbi:patatin-like phospholipase family protein [Oleiagrimonas sp.]|jgi:NTE family protein|uniref:patatin-like phospholipase family protein n=1 Tax=Oleiagrimonas sp. TaxID=2010330 RepID=UPI0026237C16|nr:patatin-like phospholipase family protein [Oleiagrimonas sp.]MDA3913666.1 patatin-like phospholipase family protein [Oleiagrimonas sp.]